MRLRAALPLACILVTLSALPLQAETNSRFKLFGAAVWASPLDSSRARLAGEVREVELGDDIGWEAGFEWRLTPFIALEASLARTSHEVRFGASNLGQVELEPIYVSVNFHLANRERWDWWVAPTVAFFEWRDAGFRRGVKIDEGRDEGFGATVGLDYELSDRWSWTAAARYVDMQIRFAGGGEAAVDPFSVRGGLALRF